MRLIRWDTPFVDERVLSAKLLEDPVVGELVLIVEPREIDKYPKYVLRFEFWIAYKVEDESYAPTGEVNSIECSERELSSYYWIESPWLREFKESEETVRMNYGSELKHFVISAADVIVEVLATEDPKVETVAAKSGAV